MNIAFVASSIADKLREWLTGWSGALLSIIPKTIYALCTFIFSIMDILQILIRKLAGLDQVYYTSTDLGTTGPQTGDIAYNFIEHIFLGKTTVLTNVFWSLIILGLIMLFLTTLIAIFRSEFATMDAKSASKGKIIGQAFKAIASFAIVPIIAFFGMYLANIILQAINSATAHPSSTPVIEGVNLTNYFKTTNGQIQIYYNFIGNDSSEIEDLNIKNLVETNATPISGQIFAASAYRANRIRFYSIFWKEIAKEEGSATVDAGIFRHISNKELAASFLDDCFANSYFLKTTQKTNIEPFKDDYLYSLGKGDSFFANKSVTFNTFDKNNVALVWHFYDLWDFDFIICIATLVVAGKLLVDLVFGLMKRIFELIILFLIAAPIASLMPLDNGEGLKKWRTKFISKAIGTYAPIAGLNLLFIILPELSTIKFFNIPGVDKIVSVIFIIVGLLMVKDLVAMIAELVGGDDTLKAGEGMAKAVGDTLASVGKVATTPVRLGVGAVKTGYKAGKYVGGKIKQGMERDAETGALLSDIKEGRMQNSEGKTITEADFTNMSGYNQRKILKRARLAMSDEAKVEAHKNAKFNRQAARRMGFGSFGMHYKKSQLRDAESAGQRGAKKHGKFVEYNISKDTIDTATRHNDSIVASGDYKNALKKQQWQENIKKLFEEGKITHTEMSSRLNQPIVKLSTDEQKALNRKDSNDAIIKQAKRDMHDVSAQRPEDTILGRLGQKINNLPIIKTVNKSNAEYSNFNARMFGAEGTAERAKAEQRIQEVKIKEGSLERELFKGLGAFTADFKNALTAVIKTLGGEFAKGFKEGGGMGGIFANLRGVSEKNQKFGEEVKNQKKVLAAQREAERLLAKDGGGKSSGSSKLEIGDASIDQLAEAIAKKIGK